MTIIELIDRVPVGEVMPKRVLAVLKRAGVIESYSRWGYLTERENRPYMREYKGRYFQVKYLDGCFNPYLIKANIVPKKRKDYLQFKGQYRFTNICPLRDVLVKQMWDIIWHMPYNKNVFEKMYAYADRKEKAFQVHRTRERIKPINRRICMWGSIC